MELEKPVVKTESARLRSRKTLRQKMDAWMAGEGRGVLDSAARGALWCASHLFHTGVAARGWSYDSGLLIPKKAPLPVISVGNITTGGTGKSPFVAWLVKQLIEDGSRPAVVTRGYGARKAGGENEEVRWMRAVFGEEVPVIVSKDRFQGARKAWESRAEVAVLDDGFQHRRLYRDLDIVLVDSLNPFGYGYFLPRGLLREHPSSLKRAGMIILTRTDQVSKEWLDELATDIGKLAPEVPLVKSVHSPVELVEYGTGEARFPLEHLDSCGIAAACAIGNPKAFGRTLRRLGADVKLARRFPDHYNYTLLDIDRLMADAESLGAEAVIVTEKDAVKFPKVINSDVPVLVLKIEIKITEGGEVIMEKVAEAMQDYEPPEQKEKPDSFADDDVTWEDAPVSRTRISIPKLFSGSDTSEEETVYQPSPEKNAAEQEDSSNNKDDDPLQFVRRRRE